MEAAELHRRIKDVWDRLPTIFTVRDVCLHTGLSDQNPTTRVDVHALLDEMVGEGRLFRSLVLSSGDVGRKPSAWSKSREGLPEEIVQRAVRAVLPRMPRYFTLKVLLEAVGTSQRFSKHLRRALSRLEDDAVVVRVSERNVQMRAGRPPTFWSADPNVIAAELAWKAARAQQQREMQESHTARLDRLLKPFNPFGSA